MKRNVIFYLAIGSGICLSIGLFFQWYGYSPWKSGDMGPRQYYRQIIGGRKADVTKTLNGISYTFDEIGSCIQNEKEGEWIQSESGTGMQYQLKSGNRIKHTWYQIDQDWYYFNKNGISVRDQFLVTNGKKYYLDGEGKMKTGEILVNGDYYYANRMGVIQKRRIVFVDGACYETNRWGKAVKKTSPDDAETVGNPRLIVDGKMYFKHQPEYFFRKDYEYLFEIINVYETPDNDREGYGYWGKCEVYASPAQPDKVFVYEGGEKVFFSYTTQPIYGSDYNN